MKTTTYVIAMKDGSTMTVEATRHVPSGELTEFRRYRTDPPQEDPQWYDVVLSIATKEIKSIGEEGKFTEKPPDIGIA